MGCAQSGRAVVENDTFIGIRDGADYERAQSDRSSPYAPGDCCFHRHYVLHQKLGKGAFGAVYLVQNVDNQSKPLACKISDLSHQDQEQKSPIDSKRRSVTMKEIALLSLVASHENVIQMVDSFIEDSLSYIVMERCDWTLLQVLESMPILTESSVKPILQGMLEGLSAVHRKGVVHRDVKPDNFMCTSPHNTVKLCDFGLASKVASADGNELTGVYGTPQYMAPEVCKGQAQSGKVDVWSLGVVAYVICFGCFPYTPARRTGQAMKAAIAAGRLLPNFAAKTPQGNPPRGEVGEVVSSTCVAWMRQLLCREPTRRPSCREALSHDFLIHPSWGSHKGRGSLRPMLCAARRCGAFEAPLGHLETQETTAVDVRLRLLQGQQHGRAAGQGSKQSPLLSEMSTQAGSVKSNCDGR